MLRKLGSLAAAASLLAAFGCGGGQGGDGGQPSTGTQAVYLVPASLDELSETTFFDHPWPSDLRLEGGSPRFAGFCNPRGNPLLSQYIAAAKGLLDGFSPAAAGFLRFTGPIDETTLPATPSDALDPSSSVQLIDIDPSSPEHGTRKLVSLQWRAEEGVFCRSNTLAFMPTIGFPLRPRTRYALVVNDALHAKAGGAVVQQADLAKVLGARSPDAGTQAANGLLASAVTEIEAAGLPRARVVHLAVFTTADPVRELFEIRDALADIVPAPQAAPEQWAYQESTADYDVYTGSYWPTPNFQVGTPPFTSYGDGGYFIFKKDRPLLQGTYDLRFSLAVPLASKCPPPASGYPIVLYAHGPDRARGGVLRRGGLPRHRAAREDPARAEPRGAGAHAARPGPGGGRRARYLPPGHVPDSSADGHGRPPPLRALPGDGASSGLHPEEHLHDRGHQPGRHRRQLRAAARDRGPRDGDGATSRAPSGRHLPKLWPRR